MSTTDPFVSVPDLEELLRFPGSMASNGLAQTYGQLTQEGLTHILQLCGALWLHSGDLEAPHAGLTSGKCSNGFVDVLRALRYTNICDILAYHMTYAIEAKLEELAKANENLDTGIDWVVGSDHAGATFSYNVAEWLGSKHDFTEKGPNKTHLWKRFDIGKHEMVLQVEELMTTSETLIAVRDGIRKGNPALVTFTPVVGVLVHRSDVYEIEGAPVVYLAHYDIQSWWPNECPLCAQGSKRISEPKKHWAELVGGA